jgi:hypothetical protein
VGRRFAPRRSARDLVNHTAAKVDGIRFRHRLLLKRINALDSLIDKPMGILPIQAERNSL